MLTGVDGRDVLRELYGRGIGTQTDARIRADAVVLPARP